jgi:hypothetical protein
MSNINTETGVRFTVYSANSLHSDVLHTLWDDVGTDVTYEEACRELREEIVSDANNIEEECAIDLHEAGGLTSDEFDAFLERDIEAAYERLGYQDRDDYIDTRFERECEYIQIDEPNIEGEYEGIKYAISWLGGAPLLWVFESPFKQNFDLCSPCVPNACDGNNPNPEGYEGYAVDPDWLDLED